MVPIVIDAQLMTIALKITGLNGFLRPSVLHINIVYCHWTAYKFVKTNLKKIVDRKIFKVHLDFVSESWKSSKQKDD